MIDINVGLTANDGLGDPLRDAMIIINANFDELKDLIDAGATQVELDNAVAILNSSISDIYSILDTKSDIGHTHLISEINGLQTILDGLVTSTTFNTQISSINNSIALINQAILDIELTDNDLQNQIDIINATFSNIDAKLLLKQNLPTGFITGLTLSITPGTGNTKFDISPGAYAITNFDDLQNITVEIIQLPLGLTGISPQYLTQSNASYIALDENKTVIQSSSPFDNDDRRHLALIGAVIHSNLTTINTTNEIKAPIVAPTNQLHDFMNAVGRLNLNGNEFTANGANLMLDKSAGQIFGMGINGGDFTDPHRLTIGATQALTFRYRLQNGTEFSDTQVLNPTQYDLNGVLTTLSNNNRWSIQHINMFQSGLVRIQYGQHEYNSFNEAVGKAFTETFTVENNIAENSILRAYLVMKKNITNLQSAITAGDAAIIQVDKFGNAVGGPGNALTLASIIAALGYTPEDVANKATTFGTINDTLYPTVKAVNDRLLSITTDVWRKSGMTISATNSTDNVYRSGSVNIVGSNKFFSTGPTEADITGEILGTNFGHISPAGGTVPFIQLLSNYGNGSAGTNHFIGRFVGAGVNNPQMNFSAIKSTSYNAWGDSGRVLFRFNDGYLSPQTKFDIGTDYIKFNSYPSTRNDIVSGTISNILYTDSVGTLKSTNVNNIFGFTPENVANKATTFLTINDTLYPTTKAVSNRINGALANYVDLDSDQYILGIKSFGQEIKADAQLWLKDGSGYYVKLKADNYSFDVDVHTDKLAKFKVGSLSIYNSGVNAAIIDSQSLTGNRTYNLPDSSGTVSLVGHTHSISNITGLTASLDNKLSKYTGATYSAHSIWTGTQADYTALGTYSSTTLYFIL